MESTSVRLIDCQGEADIYDKGFKQGVLVGKSEGWQEAHNHYIPIVEELKKKIELLEKGVG